MLPHDLREHVVVRVDIALLAVKNGSIGQSDPDAFSQGCAKIEQAWPFSRILRAGDLPVGAIDDRIGAIAIRAVC